MLVYLWLQDGQPPKEYIDLVLCRDVYHCTPSELYQQDARIVMAHLACLDVEAEVARLRAEREAGRKNVNV